MVIDLEKMASLRLIGKSQTCRVGSVISHTRPCCLVSFSSGGHSKEKHWQRFNLNKNANHAYNDKFDKATQPSLPGIDAMPFIQAFKSKEHEFTKFRSSSLDRSGEESDVCIHGNYIDRDTTEDPYNNCYQPMSNVSLYSVMQTNVPEPYSKNPGHRNMPGGGVKLQDKITAGQRHDIHCLNNGGNRRTFCTSSAHLKTGKIGDQGIQGPFPWLEGETVESLSEKENPAPQGVQGMNCDQFKLWLANCTKYNIIECDQQLNELKEGRKTLAQIFEEQEMVIQQVTEDYQSKASHPKVSSEQPGTPNNENKKLSQKERLKQAVSQYGATVIIFHVGISLVSLGGFYLAVSRLVCLYLYLQLHTFLILLLLVHVSCAFESH